MIELLRDCAQDCDNSAGGGDICRINARTQGGIRGSFSDPKETIHEITRINTKETLLCAKAALATIPADSWGPLS
jgi:hypothetical protein